MRPVSLRGVIRLILKSYYVRETVEVTTYPNVLIAQSFRTATGQRDRQEVNTGLVPLVGL